MAAAAAAPLPPGTMVGAAKPLEVVVVTDLSLPDLEAVGLAVPLAEVELSPSPPALMGALGGSIWPQSFWMLSVQAFWPSALPTCWVLHWLKRVWQMKEGMV